MFRTMTMIAAACCLSLSACGPTGGVASAGSVPATGDFPATIAAGMLDGTLPPPAAVSPTAKTTIDDATIAVAWEGLRAAATASRLYLTLKPTFAGTPTAVQLADGLDAASTWLTIASQAQRASQAENYAFAISQARSAIASAQDALAKMKGQNNGR